MTSKATQAILDDALDFVRGSSVATGADIAEMAALAAEAEENEADEAECWAEACKAMREAEDRFYRI